MYERGVVVAHVVADYNSLLKVKLRQSYTELMGEYLKLVWPRVNVSNLKDVGYLDFNIPYLERIAYPTH